MVKQTSDGKWTNSSGMGGDSGKVGAGINGRVEISYEDAVFASCASIYKSGAGADDFIRNQPRNARGTYDYIKLLKFCQVVAAVE